MDKHVDSLPYAWWEAKNRPLPETIKHKNNHVLSLEEMQEYRDALAEYTRYMERRLAKLDATLRAIKTGQHLWYMRDEPVLFTIAHVLEECVSEGKYRLKIMNLLAAIAQSRRKNDGDPQSPVA